MTEAVDSVMINIGAFFAIAGGIIMMLFVVGMVGYLVALLWISACNKWRAICRAESLIFEYRKKTLTCRTALASGVMKRDRVGTSCAAG